MRIENDDSVTFTCDNCGEEILDAPLQELGRPDVHWCSTYCCMKWTCRPLLATVNGARVTP